MPLRTDVAIIGGGIMGSALAYWLTTLDPALDVTVIERDPTYATASSALSASSIRQQFSMPANIRISQASISFLRAADEHLRVGEARPHIGLVERGYLYLAGAAQEAALRDAYAVQRCNGADSVLLERSALKQRFAWLNVDDIVLGTLGNSGEGWFDGYALLSAFARKARAQGAHYVTSEASGLAIETRRVARVELHDGSTIACDRVVNAAGPWAAAVARWAGIDLPVTAQRRTVFVIACKASLPDMPLVIDPSGFWIRPEGRHFIAGIASPRDADEAPLEPEYALFEASLWPALALRIPAFEQARLVRAWAGYYEMNVFDQNAIIGPHPGIDNLFFINGFSGHGMQQAPIVARAVAEMILTGRFQTLDLSDFQFQRLLDGRALPERNVIG